MKFLLDTNAVSEPQKPTPNKGYMTWLLERDPSDLAITSLTLGELTRGVTALPSGRRRTELAAWLSEALTFFDDRILSIDTVVAAAWADVWARHHQLGRPVGVIDELTAAAALSHGLIVVTRNVRHFENSGCDILSPWSA